MLSRLIYSQIPLAAWVTRQTRTRPAFPTSTRRRDHTIIRVDGRCHEIRGSSSRRHAGSRRRDRPTCRCGPDRRRRRAAGSRSSAPSNRHVAAATSIARSSTARPRVLVLPARRRAARRPPPRRPRRRRPSCRRCARAGPRSGASRRRRRPRSSRPDAPCVASTASDAEVDQPRAQRVERLAVEQRRVVLADLDERGVRPPAARSRARTRPGRSASRSADSGRSPTGRTRVERVGELAPSARRRRTGSS